jgi:hypothetical protein
MCVSAVAAQKADFSGTWVLDKSRSEGLPPGMEQTMTVRQAGDRLDIEMKMSGPQGNEEIKDQFILDGKETDYTPTVMKGYEVTRGKRTPKWAGDGKGFDLLEDATVDGPNGALNIKVTRHWQLAEDGKTLTVDVAVDGPRGIRKSKRVYARK